MAAADPRARRQLFRERDAFYSPAPADTPAEVPLDEGMTSVFQYRTGRWLEIRRVRFQAHRLRLVRRAERRQDEAETDGYLGNVG